MPRSPVALGIPIRVSREPVLHTASQIGIGCLNQRVKRVWHPARGENHPSAPLDLIFQPFYETLIVPRIAEQLPATVTASDDMIVGTCQRKSCMTRYGVSRLPVFLLQRSKPTLAEHRTQGLIPAKPVSIFLHQCRRPSGTRIPRGDIAYVLRCHGLRR